MKIYKWQAHIFVLVILVLVGTACGAEVEEPVQVVTETETPAVKTVMATVTTKPTDSKTEIVESTATLTPVASLTLEPTPSPTAEPTIEAFEETMTNEATPIAMSLSSRKTKTEHSTRPEGFQIPASVDQIAPPPEISWQVLETEETVVFQTYDGVRVSEEGEAWLDLGDLMHLILKRDTVAQIVPGELSRSKLSEIDVDFGDETPLGQRIVLAMHLTRGGFFGEKLKGDGTIALTTPNAVIVVSGTEFFIAYDPDIETTWVGNFEGTVDVADIELEEGESLPDRQFIAIPAVDDRNNWPIHEHLTPEEFERLVDLLESPIAVADMISGPYLVVEFDPEIGVRDGPGPDFNQIGFMEEGDYARIIGQSNGWWQIDCPITIIDLGTGCWVGGEPNTMAYNTDDVPRVAQPTPVASSCSPPSLNSPGIGYVYIEGENPALSWNYACALDPDEFFDVRLWRDGEPHYGVTWTKNQFYSLDSETLGNGRHNWSVAVVQGQDGVVDTVLVEEGPSRWFDLQTSPATPTPTPEPQLGTGDVQITLKWNNTADLDLRVFDPNGEEIYYDNKNSSSGGQLDVDANVDCDNANNSPVENIFWPVNAAPSGNYEVRVDYFAECEDSGTTDFTVTVLRDGNSNMYFSTLSPGDPVTTITNFSR